MTIPKSITARFMMLFLPLVLLVSLGALFLHRNETKANEAIIKLRETFNIENLQEGLRSSSGSPGAFTASSRALSPEDYYWKLVSRVPPLQIRAGMDIFTTRRISTSIFLLVVMGIGAGIVANSCPNTAGLKGTQPRHVDPTSPCS